MSSKQSRPPGFRGARSASQARPGVPGARRPGPRLDVTRPARSPGARPAGPRGGVLGANATARAYAAQEWMRSRNLSLEIVAVLVVVVIAVIALGGQVKIWFNQRQQIADLQVQVAQAKQDLAEMKVERKRWEDPVYIRSQARDRLYYVLPGEVSYLVMDANGINTSDVSGTMGAKLTQQRSSSQISASILRTKKNWVDSIMQSVIRAGLEEPANSSATSSVGTNGK